MGEWLSIQYCLRKGRNAEMCRMEMFTHQSYPKLANMTTNVHQSCLIYHHQVLFHLQGGAGRGGLLFELWIQLKS